MKDIIARCKAGVHLTVNGNRDVYESVEIAIMEVRRFGENITEEQEKKMIEADVFIHFQFYPDTPVGCYSLYGHDLDEVIAEAKEILDI